MHNDTPLNSLPTCGLKWRTNSSPSTMSTRGKNEACCICGGSLQGNQRRWLFGGQNKKGSHPQTPTDSLSRGSLSRSSQSSPWGSTLSLRSSMSLSNLSSPSKAVDLLAILTHILGQSVQRRSGQGEFLCGKCVSILERVFKFDSVISRVRALSSERLQKLTQDRDKIRLWVRNAFSQQHPQIYRVKGSTSEEDGEGEKEGYRQMLKDNMALSEFECWSEKWDPCPHFRRTGRRCTRGKCCEGCDSLRVADSDYESVCGVPRHLPFQPFSPLALSRDKSQSMPLHWSRPPSRSSSPGSLAGSNLSLRAPSRSDSIRSMDSLDSTDPFDWPHNVTLNLGYVLKELKSIERKPLGSPSGSKIPVLGRKEGRQSSGGVGEPVTRVLSFGDGQNGEDSDQEVDGDILSEMRDEFMPLHRESQTGRMQLAVRQLRGQLDQAMARIKTLEAELKRDSKPSTKEDVNGSEDWLTLPQKQGGSVLLQCLGHSLHSRERVIQECMALIRKLCVEVGTGTDVANKVTQQLTENLKITLADNKQALGRLNSEMKNQENLMERQIEALRKAAIDRDRDIHILNTVLQCNQDIINELRVELGEKERLQKEVEKEREVWKHKDQALTAVVQEKETLLRCLKEALESCQKDVLSLSDSVIGQGLSGGGVEATLAYQLKEKETLLATWMKEREENSATMCREVHKLTTALQDYQAMVKNKQENHVNTVSSLSEQLKDTRSELRERENEKKEAEKAWQNDRNNQQREERKLRESLEKRDKFIEQVLVDSEERDQLFKELHQNLMNKYEPLTAVKHTL